MAYDWDNARLISLGQIEKYGAPGSVVKKGTTGGFDSNGDVKAAVPDVVIPGTITSLSDYKPREIDGTVIQVGDSWAYFHSETPPEIGMQTTVNGVDFRIVGTPKLVSLDGVVIWQKLQLRK